MSVPRVKPQDKDPEAKIQLETIRVPSDKELEIVGEMFSNFYKWRSYRSGSLIQLQNLDLETYLKRSRELFWNSLITSSEDLRNLGLEFAIPFVRKEVMDYTARVTGQDITPRFNGEGLDIFGIKVIQAIYNKWRFKSNDRVEKFWQVLYGVVNGTVPIYVGYNNAKTARRYLKSYDKNTGIHDIKETQEPYWNDVWTEIAGLEDIYLPKLQERNIQKQGRLIWKTDMDFKDFKREFRSFDNAEYVYPGNQIAEDSLYFRLLSGAGVTATDRIQIFKYYDTLKDEYIINANGVWLNPVGKGEKQKVSPNPFDHKMLPFVWGINEAVDEKFAYGLSMPFKIKDPHKILNTSVTMMVERELRAIEPPILTSDFDAPKLIFGQNNVIPVNDVEAYKEMNIQEPSNQFFGMMTQMQNYMTSQANGSASLTPSKQPKSAKEVMQLEMMRQQSMGNAMTMFYDIVRQETMLVVKTALQYYPVDKYKKQEANIIRTLTIPNAPLSTGGTGQLEVRLVKKKKSEDIELFFESLRKSIMNGKQTEIIEAPIDFIQNLEFEITSIDLEPTQTDDMRKAAWVDQVLNPMVNVYIPAGVADLGKVFLRHMEKLGEFPADFANDKIVSQLMNMWNEQNSFKPFDFKGNVTAPAGTGGGQAGAGASQGAAMQSNTGMKFGGQNTKI